ncbi:MAG TPA: glycosyltransferase family 2 protein, partial [Thermoanaerobaculia bacterium]|nr:glycosyltransferase family 2 protein [Thermoanaerobaculia bacterium]
GYEVVRCRPSAYVPGSLLGLGTLVNALFPALPLFNRLSLVTVFVLRPVMPEASRPSLSVVIPARNEKGNVESALTRMPDLGAPVEIVFVEGHSTDGTWEEIQRVLPLYADRFRLAAYKQAGKGKNDAVRMGFSKATGDLLTILDADLTMPPELLGRFYEAWREGYADFVNGSRLVYPMEGEAMRFLNHLGNVFFAKALSFVLGMRLSDSLCGTKLVSRRDYERFVKWREAFGEFDPFGDYELLFPASELALGVIDVPIRYRARTYGTTNISRFRHGAMLLRMTVTGFFRVKLGKTR